MAKRASPGNKLKGLWDRGNWGYWFKFRKNGKIYQGSLETKNLQEAIERLEYEKEAAGRISDRTDIHLAMDDYIRWRRERDTMAERTEESVRYHTKRFIRFSELSCLREITLGEIERFYKHLQTSVSEHTAQKYVNSLKGLLRWCAEHDRIPKNPSIGLEMARLRTSYKSRYCTPGQQAKIFEACEREDIQFILYCGFHCGLRVGEIVECRPEWFDLNGGANGVLTLVPTETWVPKDREQRSIPLTTEFRNFLDNYGIGSPFMLRPEVEAGKWRYRYDPRRPFKKCVRSVDLGWVGFHTMRHTFASRLISANVSVYKVATWIGDDVRVVQRHYGHLQPDAGDIEKGL
ncbi:MAG: tyrosine-type recombinase/integrase [Verrucomicrobiales bacterium]|jgi:integrase|nr:tyrosine-type recombinase/integrase [Verrucomicrobiales bacterium]